MRVCVCVLKLRLHTSHQLTSFQRSGVRQWASQAARGCYSSVRVTRGTLKPPGIGGAALTLSALIDAGCQAGVQPHRSPVARPSEGVGLRAEPLSLELELGAMPLFPDHLLQYTAGQHSARYTMGPISPVSPQNKHADHAVTLPWVHSNTVRFSVLF